MIGIVKFILLLVAYFLIYQLLPHKQKEYTDKECTTLKDKNILSCARDDLYATIRNLKYIQHV